MHVQTPAGWDRENRRRKDLAVGRHHDEVRRERAEGARERGVAKSLGLEHGEPARDRDLLDRRRGRQEAAPARPIGLAHHPDHRVSASEQRLENGARESRRAHEDDAPDAQGALR